MKTKQTPRSGFTLIELLTVIAIIGILAAILIPSVGAVRTKAAQAASSSDMRQIHLAHSNFQIDGARSRSLQTGEWASTDKQSQVQANSADDFAKAVAWFTGSNEAQLYFINSAEDVVVAPKVIFTGLGDARVVDTAFTSSSDDISYAMYRLSANADGSTPLLWTKGLTGEGTWLADTALSPWGSDGGHVVYAAGNVQFFSQIEEGDFRKPDGTATLNINEVFDGTDRLLEPK